MTSARLSARLILAITVCMALLASVAPAALATEELAIFPVSAVHAGLRGTGYTVVAGTKIEEFTADILGVLDGSGPSQALVLVRVSGPPIDVAGGIAAGMSGSPVYIDGKLLGAIAYGFDMADHTLGLITPAEDMVLVQQLAQAALAEKSAARPGAVPAGVTLSGQTIRSVALAPDPATAQAWRAALPQDVAIATPVATPLLIQGLSQRTMDLARKTFSRYNLLVAPGGAAPAGASGVPLEPGAALGVQLVRGDINMTAIGTVTFVTPNGGFAAFGHPFLNRGRVGFFVTSATILQTVQSLQVPFKLGMPLAPAGRLLQDRGAGIAGMLGDDPPSIDVEVYLTDHATGREKFYEAQVVRDETLAAPLLAITLLEALDRGVDRIGKGTAQITTRVVIEGRDQMVTRHNMFYSSSDIAVASLSELATQLQALFTNDITPLQVKRVVLEAEVDEDRQTARLEKAQPGKRTVKPGETVDVEILMRPYRQDPVTLVMKLPIPKELPAGEHIAIVRGGGYGAPQISMEEINAAISEEAAGMDDEEEMEDVTAEDLDNLIAKLFDRPKNYEVILELYPADMTDEEPAATADLLGSEEFVGDDEEGSEFVRVKLPTAWIVQGQVTFKLTVEAPAGNAAASADSNNKAEPTP